MTSISVKISEHAIVHGFSHKLKHMSSARKATMQKHRMAQFSALE